MLKWVLVAALVALACGVPVQMEPEKPVVEDDGSDAVCLVDAVVRDDASQRLLSTDAETAEESPCTSPFIRVKDMDVNELTRLSSQQQQEYMVIDFDAWWCDHSKNFAPRFEEMADRLVMRSDMKLIHVDVSTNEELRKQLQITGYPTVMLWKKGQSLWDGHIKFTGKRNRANLLSWVEYHAPSGHMELGSPSLAGDFPSAQAVAEQVLFCDASHTNTGAEDAVCDHKQDRLATIMAQKGPGKRGPWAPADNSVAKTVDRGSLDFIDVTDSTYATLLNDGNYLALYFYSPKCQHCACLGDVWRGVNYNLVEQGKQSQLLLGAVDGDANPQLKAAFNIKKYPTFLLANKEKVNVLGQYTAAKRRVFDLSLWIQDTIVADESPLSKHRFTDADEIALRIHENSVEGSDPAARLPPPDFDMVYPYTGHEAFPPVVGSDATGTYVYTRVPPEDCFNDQLMAEVFFNKQCDEVAGMFCERGDEAGSAMHSLCPKECDTCDQTAQNNDAAFSLVFNDTCNSMQAAECSCDLVPSMGFCDPAAMEFELIVMSRVVFSFCPVTCKTWGTVYLNKDKSFRGPTAANKLAAVQTTASVLNLAAHFKDFASH